jgi:diguanylate cyclase (GGDEF)-like protein
MRRSRLHAVRDIASDPLCGHVREPLPRAYLCVPLIAQGVAVGMLHLRSSAGWDGEALFGDDQQALAERVAEFIALALSNLNLRDSLRIQAIRDPLTGLFNRRYMEETLEREVRRAGRHKTAVGVIMFDVDKLKPVNDRFGHDAGDLMLKGVGAELLRLFRGEDVACRYGGDEFTIVLPEASLADVWRRAEQMRDAVKRLDLSYEGSKLGAITLSIGVAAYPDHGQTGERVLLASDAAAYAAKAEGGDRIMVGRAEES